MAIDTKTVWIGHDNEFRLGLVDGGTALTTDQMDAITQITLTLGDVTITSTDPADTAISWRQSGYDDNEVRFLLGGESVHHGEFPTCELVVYAPDYPNGKVWDDIVPINVEATPEN